MEQEPINFAKKELTLYIKVLGNFTKKIGKKYSVNDNNLNEINHIMHDVLASFHILINVTGTVFNQNKKLHKLPFYENNIGWSMNCAYSKLISVIKELKNNADNHCNLEKYLFSDMENFHNTYTKIRYWGKHDVYPPKDDYFKIIRNKFPGDFFCNIIANYSNKINDDEFKKIYDFIEKYTECRNFRIDFKAFFEKYLFDYDEYYPNYVIIYFLDKHNNKKDEVNILMKNIEKIENKLKLLKLLEDNNIHNTIYTELKEKQNEIVVKSKDLFSMTHKFRYIQDFNYNDAEFFWEKYKI
jgi:hypothetical protein